MSIETTTLKNGLRVVTDHISTVETVTLGVWLDVGARNEPKELNGIAHVLEHMAFKGTQERTAKDIAEAIENVGGYVNAYTSRETTAYYTRLLKGDAKLGVDIMSDILQNSTFQPSEFEREQSVIIQEIGQTYDTPDDIIFDYFQETCFPHHPMGRPILGTAEIIQSLTSDCVKQYMHDHYGAKQMVLAAAGNIQHKDLVSMAEDYFTDLREDCSHTVEPSMYKGGEFRQDRSLEQVHIVLGFEGLPYNHDDYYAAALLSTILGGGMSSRLFQEIREKRGLVYSIYAFHSAYRDSGIFGIYAGTSQEKANELLHVTVNELQHLSKTDFSADLNRAKAQLKASLMMSLESTSSRCEQLASQMHIHGHPIKTHEILQKVERVTPDHIKHIADKLFTSVPTFATLGPIKKVQGLDKLKSVMGVQ
mgnify:CR=1 FL=1